MKPEPCPLDLNSSSVTGLPIAVSLILPDTKGNAIGMNNADDNGVAITSTPCGTAEINAYGIAYSTNNGFAIVGGQGVAVAHNGGTPESEPAGKASAGDGGVSYANNGTAITALSGVAFARQGTAIIDHDGMAMVMLKGSATVNGVGVACALNLKIIGSNSVTDPTVGRVSAGAGGMVVAFTSKQPSGAPRTLMVGFVGEKPESLSSHLEADLLACGVQFGLDAGQMYALSSVTGKFVKVS